MTDNSFRKYASFWSKYRPVVLKMMQASMTEKQQYQFMQHELSSIDKKPKGGFDFHLVITGSKPTRNRNTRESEIANDLLNMLRASQSGSAMMATNNYEITLDKKHTLSIVRQDPGATEPKIEE